MLLLSTRMLLHSLAILADRWESGERMNCKDIERLSGLQARTISSNLTKLSKAGILNSTTGGTVRGYKFAVDPRSVTVGDILNIVEGGMTFHCGKNVIEGVTCSNSPEKCSIYQVYSELYSVAMERLATITIYDFSVARNSGCDF